MADTTFQRGNYERYDADPAYLSSPWCTDPDSVKQAAEDDKAWAHVIDDRGNSHRRATTSEDQRKHFDVVELSNNEEIKYEIKGPKALKKGHAKQDRRLLIERRWVYESEANFHCFRRVDGKFLVVPTKDLQSVLDKKKLDWEKPTTHPKDPATIKNNVVYIRPSRPGKQGAKQSPFIWVDAAELESIGGIHGESSQATGTSN